MKNKKTKQGVPKMENHPPMPKERESQELATAYLNLVEEVIPSLQHQLAAANAEIEKWEDRYNKDYQRAVELIRESSEIGHKLITVQDTVVAIGKMMDEIENFKWVVKNLTNG